MTDQNPAQAGTEPTVQIFKTPEALAEALKKGTLAFADVPAEIYHKTNAISHSMLKKMRESPAKFRWEIDHPRASSPAQSIGSAIHTALLEPELFDSTYAVQPKFDRRTKEGKAKAEAWEAENAGRTPIDHYDMDTVGRVSDRVNNDEFFQQFFKTGYKEKSFFVCDEETGLNLRCRPDNVLFDKKVILDLKTTDCAGKWSFNSDITKYDYLTQAAFYMDTVAASGAMQPEHFIIVAVEKSRDCDIAVYYFKPEHLEIGRKRYRAWLRQLSDCIKADAWPGYERKFISYNPPQWLLNEVDGGEW